MNSLPTYLTGSLRRTVGCEYDQSVLKNIFIEIHYGIIDMVVRVKIQQTTIIVKFIKYVGLQ